MTKKKSHVKQEAVRSVLVPLKGGSFSLHDPALIGAVSGVGVQRLLRSVLAHQLPVNTPQTAR